MIKSLQLSNFQSHQRTQLDLDPGVNVIVGPSDSGKTALIRALRWLIWNRPSGDAFRSNWGGDTSVFVELGDPFKAYVTREKGKHGNFYNLSEEDLIGFGNDVPEQVQEAINMDETNLQMQLDSPFLISDSPGDVARYFNRIAHLDQIDSGLKKIQSKMRKLSYSIDEGEERVNTLSTELQTLEYLDKFEIDLEALEADEKTVNSKYHTIQKIQYILMDMSEVDAGIREYKEFISNESAIDNILQMHTKRNALKEDLKNLQHDKVIFQKLEEMISYQEKRQKLLKSVNDLLDWYGKVKRLEETRIDIQNIVDELLNIEGATEQIEEELHDHEERFHELMPDICPLCEQPIKK